MTPFFQRRPRLKWRRKFIADLIAPPMLRRLIVESLDAPTADRLRPYTHVADACKHASGLWFAPASPGTWAAEKIKELPDESLLKSGWFTRRRNGRWRLAPKLCTPCAPVIALQTERPGFPYAVVTEGNQPGGHSWLWLHLHDLETRQRIATFNGALIVTETIQQSVVWRLLGLAACPIADLEDKSDQHYRRLAALLANMKLAKFHLIDPTREPPKRRMRSKLIAGRRTARSAFLVVPAWDPVTLKYIAPDAIRRLLNLATLIEPQPQNYYPVVRFWSVSAGKLETIRRATHVAEEDELRAILKTSLNWETKRKLEEYHKRHHVATLHEPAPPLESLTGLSGQLNAAAHGDGAYDGVQTQFTEQRLLTWKQRRLILPWRERAASFLAGRNAQPCNRLADIEEEIQQVRAEHIKASARAALFNRDSPLDGQLRLHRRKWRICSEMLARRRVDARTMLRLRDLTASRPRHAALTLLSTAHHCALP